MGLAWRLAFSFLIPTTLGLAVYAFIADHVARTAFEEQISLRLISVAKAERAILTGYFAELVGRVTSDDELSLQNLRKRIEPIAIETEVARVFLFNPTSRTSIVDTDRAIPHGHRYYEIEPDAAEIEAALRGETIASVLYTAADGTHYMYAYTPIHHPSTGEVVAILGVQGHATQLQDLFIFRRNLLLFGSISLLAVIATAVWVSNRLTSVVNRLVQTAHHIERGHLEDTIQPTRSDALGDLEHGLEKMRRALRQREEEMQLMLSGIAHEVRNPLGGIELFLGLLDEDLCAEGKSSQDQTRRHVVRIKHELAYLGGVVNDFLNFARKPQLQMSVFPANALLVDIADLMRSDLQRSQVTLRVQCPDDILLEADRDRIKQVIINLVRNAWQASPANTTIDVQVSINNHLYQIRITDHGPGIPADIQPHVFRPFYTTKEKGTGLGLPLARKVVEAHGGTLEIAATSDTGTTICITLIPPPTDEKTANTPNPREIPLGWLG